MKSPVSFSPGGSPPGSSYNCISLVRIGAVRFPSYGHHSAFMHTLLLLSDCVHVSSGHRQCNLSVATLKSFMFGTSHLMANLTERHDRSHVFRSIIHSRLCWLSHGEELNFTKKLRNILEAGLSEQSLRCTLKHD